MSTNQRLSEIELGPEAQGVLDWRLQVLLEAGYPADDAWSVARDTAVDLHQAADLVRNGCPSETAVAILL